MKRRDKRFLAVVCFTIATVAGGAATKAQVTAVPSPWSARDIGGPAIAGTSSFDPASGSFSIDAAGSDIFGTADQFHFVYQPLTGDAAVTARIDAVSFAHGWSKAGVMIRSSLSANAAHGFAFVSAGKGAGFQRRPSVGGSSLSTVDATLLPPQWVRLTRSGTTVTASTSANGTAWTVVGSETIALGATAYVGIAVTSHNASQSTSAQVSAVTAGTIASLPPPQKDQDIGSPAIAGSADYRQGAYTVTAGGRDIFDSADEFHYVYQPVNGDVDVSVKLSSLVDVNQSAKAGVMIRENLTPDSAHAFAGLSARNTYLFDRRSTTGGLTVNTAGGAGVAPGWVRLKRTGDLVTAYRSTDGTTWTVIGSDSFPMAASLYVGIAVTSHNVATAATAVLTNLSVTQSETENPPATALAPAPVDAGASASSFAAAAAAAAPGLVSAYALDEGTGSTVADSSGSGLNGTITGATWVPGKFGQALSFDGSDIVTFGDIDLAGSFTVMGWFQTRSLYSGTCGSFVMKARDYGFELCSGVLRAQLGSGTAFIATATKTLTSADLNVWKHVAMTYDGATVRLYVDGVLASSATGTHGTNNNPLVFGKYSLGTEYWNGLIDEVRIYSRALTAAEVQTDRNTPIGGASNQAPTATLTAPANGATFTAPASITLTANAADTDGTVARVDFYNGSTLLGSDTTAPYSFTWSSVAAGTYSVKATAVDNAGASGSSAVATITVGTNAPPTATLTAPANGATFAAPASITLTANAADTNGTVARVDFYNGATLLGSDATAPYAFTWSSVPAGTYALKAVAVDNAGATGTSATATVMVTTPANQPPTATLTAPANGATFTAPASVTLTATASDSNGTVARVDFYNGSTVLGSDTTAPYSFTWSNVAAGTYSVKATAVDNAGASGSSATATITVSGAASGLTAAYALNEGSGSSVADSSGNGWNGTITGATWVPGQYGQALSFDGSDLVTFGDVDLTGSFTVMGWFQTRSLYSGTCGSLVMKARDYGFELCSGVLRAQLGSGTAFVATATKTLTSADLNVWKHVAMTYDGATVRLYVDGVLASSATGTHGTNNNPLVFGKYSLSTDYWNGLIDEVRIYGRALTAAEVQTDRTTPIGGGTGNQPPTATLTAPANGATFTAPASVTLTATAADSNGTVARVDFYNGSTLLGSDTTAPYSFTWSSVAAGTYSVKATAVDNAGASGSSAVATITVTGNQAPTATLTAPANGATFTAPASITLTANAADANGTVARVEFYNGATLLGTDTTAPYSFTWSSVAAGSYAVRAIAYDNLGASGTSATANITVSGALAVPTAVVFQASTDHANGVTSYLLEIFANGANPNTATPVASSDLGKPAPAGNGDITVNRASVFSALAPGTYVMTVSSIGSNGRSRSASLTFTR